MSDKIKVNQILTLMGRLGEHVNWESLDVELLQGILEKPHTSGAHYEEFLRRGARMPMEESLLQITDECSFVWGSEKWQDRIDYFDQQLANSSSFDYSSLYRELNPYKYEFLRHAQLKSKSRVVTFSFNPKGGSAPHQTEILHMFRLYGVYPASIPEAMRFLETEKPQLKLPLVLLNTFKGFGGRVETIAFEQRDRLQKKYSVFVFSAENMGYWSHNFQFLAARY